MSEEMTTQPLRLGALPRKVQRLFDAKIAEAHEIILGQIRQVEDPAERGPSLQDEGGRLKCTVTLAVEISACVAGDDVSDVGLVFHVDMKAPKLRAVRETAFMRPHGLTILSDAPDESAIPFPKRSSRIG